MFKSKFNPIYQSVMSSCKLINETVSERSFRQFKFNYPILKKAITAGVATEKEVNQFANQIVFKEIKIINLIKRIKV